MRFPRLSHLFHRRAKSDGDLNKLASVPTAVLAPRRASANGFDELVLAANHPADTFASYITAVPVSATQPFPDPPAAVAFSHPGLASTELKERIRELEAALAFQYKANRRIPALETALQTERAALEVAKQTNEKLAAEVVALRTNLIQTQRQLRLAPNADDRACVLAAENSSLTAERLRHRKFIELMVAVGGHKPVLDRASCALFDGIDPEAALVSAIKDAVAQPGSVWATLLDPVLGPRTPNEYSSQVRCTLRARQDAREWHKRAKFWKGKARESSAHLETVTPSVSNISSVVEVLSGDRQRALDILIERRRASGASAEAMEEDTTNALELQFDEHEPDSDEMVSVYKAATSTRSSVPSALATLVSFSSLLMDNGEASTASADIFGPLRIPLAGQLPISDPNLAPYANLAPLASETFRASHSIVNSRRSSASYSLSFSGSFSRSLSHSLTFFGYATEIERDGISASRSASSHASNNSRSSARRRMEVLGIAEGSDLQVSPEESGPSTGSSLSGSIASSLARLGTNEESGAKAGPAPAAIHTTSPTSLSMSSLPVPSFISRTPQRSQDGLPSLLEINGERDSDEELVIVMHSDAPSVVRNSPKALKPSSPSASGKSTATPEKSRLPVLKKAIRRLSISRPVLIDSTNAATFSFSTAAAKIKSPRHPVTPSKPVARIDIRARAAQPQSNGKENGGPRRIQKSPGSVSPICPSKIPMGRRMQPLELMNSARRAVQSKTRMRTGTT
ncbi:uncharacterized protein FIBRA_07613 [Fibroporia radiculosa]|uniref:Uncharacterized protein n=1 Tax=Fibroporia radiculosa TaxID=599839 RepID=J4I104_9APHY|nr:uncharacterized protein FIBRA_07613 [Fibroporia radiculosa]CCM05397.1 predicted protein [Fibroporia radiculosa]